MSTGLAVVLVVAVLVPAHVVVLVVRRPQRGLLLLAALVPFDGLLLVVPDGTGTVAGWKEGLVLATLLATLVAPATARRAPGEQPPVWLSVVVLWALLGLGYAAVAGGQVGLWGLKVGYFYMLVPVILWRCPFDERDRDRLVSVLMATGLATVAIGLAQQVVGAERLNALGYEYNDTIRFSGGLLRSFASFTQPFSFGLFVALVMVVCLPVALSDPRRRRNRWFLVVSPVLAVGLASSVVRGAILALVLGLVLLAAWRHRVLVHAVAPLLVVALLLPLSLTTAFLSTSSLGERSTGWSEITDRVLTAPLGNGLGVTGAAAERSIQAGADPADMQLLDGQVYLPDNQYVKTAVELGVVGLWLLLLLGAALFVAAVRAARDSAARGAHADRALAEGIAASVAGAGAAALVSTYLEIFPLDFFFWLFMGVLLCYPRASTSTPSPCGPAGAASRPTSANSSGRSAP